MISKYKTTDRKQLKQYKASRVKTGTASNGKGYTVFNIADAKQVNEQWVYDNYSVFSWQPEIELKDDDKIEFNNIYALEVKEEEYNGKKSIKKTIFADITVVGQKHTNKVDIVEDAIDSSHTLLDDLPF